MKTKLHLTALVLPLLGVAEGQSANFTNFIRQTVLETSPPVYWDVTVAPEGERLSPLAIDLAGSRYELWTVKGGSQPVSYLLDTAFVSSFAPTAQLAIITGDPDGNVPRTRADQPFSVEFTIGGLLSAPDAPEMAKSVQLLHHVQSYGDTYGEGIDPADASLESRTQIDQNGAVTLNYGVTSIPGGDRTAVRGEERFSVYTLGASGVDEQQLVSRSIRIWPLATASIQGITQGQTIRFDPPPITIEVGDLYPKSYTYAQIYKGAPALGTEGTKLPSAQLMIDQERPDSRVWRSDNYDQFFEEDGQWTLEVVTETVFGTERLAYLSFVVDRTLDVRSQISTLTD